MAEVTPLRPHAKSAARPRGVKSLVDVASDAGRKQREVKHKVSELEGALLDAAVAAAELIGRFGQWQTDGKSVRAFFCAKDVRTGPSFPLVPFSPSTDWQDGGPIIERERIHLNPLNNDEQDWEGFISGRAYDGPTPLIAAMRAYVASKLGEEVELP